MTRAGTQPPHTRGTRGCRAAGRRVNGMTTCVGGDPDWGRVVGNPSQLVFHTHKFSCAIVRSKTHAHVHFTLCSWNTSVTRRRRRRTSRFARHEPIQAGHARSKPSTSLLKGSDPVRKDARRCHGSVAKGAPVRLPTQNRHS